MALLTVSNGGHHHHKHSGLSTTSLAMALSMLLLVRACDAAYSPSTNWNQAHATFYGGSDASGTMGGACGYGDLYSTGYGTATAALSAALFNGGAACGACFQLMCYGSNAGCLYYRATVTITATNFCPTGSLGGWCDPPREHFDMAQPAFQNIAATVAGVIPVKYRRVNCNKSGGIIFTINGNANFNLVLVTNVGGAGDVASMRVKGSNTGWVPMERNWGENWLCTVVLVSQSLSFEVTTSDGEVSLSVNVAPPDWSFGQSFAGSQFP